MKNEGFIKFVITSKLLINFKINIKIKINNQNFKVKERLLISNYYNIIKILIAVLLNAILLLEELIKFDCIYNV